MKRLSSISIIVIGLIVLGIQPLFQAVSAALPSGLYDAVKADFGGLDWTPSILNGREYTEQQILTASDSEVSDYFGYSIALDGNTALIGAWNNGDYQGAAYVFVRSEGVWTQQARLVADDGESEDVFGSAVALQGEMALISAPEANNEGAVYVFVRTGNDWTQQAKFSAQTEDTVTYFGGAIALDGDTALIGAPLDGIEADEQQGSAFVFVRNGTTWTQQARFIISDGSYLDWFGDAVALDGNTALIGAPFDDVGGVVDSGSAYVFVRNGTTWTLQAHLVASDGAFSAWFGDAVALDGNTAVIGAPRDDVGSEDEQGSAYVYVRNGTSWTHQAKLKASDGAEIDTFGDSVSLDGDRVLVGAPRGSGNASEQGFAYIFEREGNNWIEITKLESSNPVHNELFGTEVELQGKTAMIGAAGNQLLPGSVYVFRDIEIPPTPTMTPSPTATLEPGTTQLMQNSGFENLGGDDKPDQTPWIVKNGSKDKVKCNKDENGDGIPDKIVAYSGNCTFKFKNVPGEAGKLQQTIDLSSIVPIVGDTLNLSFFARSKGGATVKAKVIFAYADDTKTKIAVESSGNQIFTEFTGSGTITSTAIVKSKINFKSVQTSGVVYVDEVSLKHKTTVIGVTETPTAEATSTETPTPEATATETPIETPTDTPEARLGTR